MGLEDVLARLPELTGDAVSISEYGAEGALERPVWVNGAFERQTGYALAELGDAAFRLLHGDRLTDEIEREIATCLLDGRAFRGDLPCQRKDGTVYLADVSIAPWQDPASGTTYVVRVLREIPGARQGAPGDTRGGAEPDIEPSEESRTQARITQGLDMLPGAFALYDADRRLVTFNKAFWQSYTSREGEIRPGMHIVEVARVGYRNGRFLSAAETEEELLDEVDRVWLTHLNTVEREFEPGRFERILRSRTPMGDIVVLRIDVTQAKRQEQALKTYSEALERANAEIRQQAIRDSLTGVLNRRGHERRLERLLEAHAAGGDEVALLHVDLDRFKQINDAFGHATGDAVLCHVAELLSELTGQADCVARIGGDEFLVSLPITTQDAKPVLLARQFLGRLAAPFVHDGHSCRIGASIGIATTPLAGSTASELAARSDYALYKAKRGRRNRVRNFDRAMRREVIERRTLSEDLLAGLGRGEIEPAYQAQVEAETLNLHGAEALARWRHPARGLLGPEVFMPVAQELGVVAEIDRQVFLRAIDEMSAMCARGLPLPRLSFNVSTGRVSDRHVLSDVERTGKFPGQVVFELLESIFVEQADVGFLLTIDRLRDMGVAFEVDDFGSGHSSIIALTRIAPERLKIDGRLVTPIVTSDSAMKLVRAVADIGHALEIAVTAEGIESAAHAEKLRGIGCSVLQGHHISEPLSADAFERLLRSEGWRGDGGDRQQAGFLT